jgi:hypothetical protein
MVKAWRRIQREREKENSHRKRQLGTSQQAMVNLSGVEL